jgi:hypothetical protein
MLDLERRQDILGITVFRDHDNDDHLPGPPKISRDAGGPMFDLMTYRKFFDDTAATRVQDWKDRNTRSYSYRVRGVPRAGSETAGPVTSSESDVLLIQPPVAG